MKKNILVLTGRPRTGGNTDLLADAFIEGAEAAGHVVTKWKAAHKNIDGCKVCNTCFTTEKACSFDDDFNELAPLIEKADVLVWAAPVYWFSFPAKIKAAIDKMYSFYVAEKQIKVKELVLLTCAEMEEMSVFNGITTSYKQIAAFLQLTDRGILAVPSVCHKGDIIATTALHKAKDMGQHI